MRAVVSKEMEGGEHSGSEWVKRFLTLFFIGFFIILVGIILMAVAALLSGEGIGSVGGFILIGPFPIVFGAGPEAEWLALFAFVLGILCITLFFILRRKLEKRV